MDALVTSEMKGKLFLFLLGILLIHFFYPKASYLNSELTIFELLSQSHSSEEADYELFCGAFETIEGRSIFY